MDSILQELQDPITLDLLEDPITVPCCTKAFSRQSLVSFLQGAANPVCPNCRGTLDDFDVAQAPRNVVLASMVDNLRGGGASGASAPSSEHRWKCTLTPIVSSEDDGDNESKDDEEKKQHEATTLPGTAQLVLSCSESKFRTRPSLFVAVVDESGSMSGRPMDQVRTALNHMVGLAESSASNQVELKIISYSSSAVMIDHPSEYGRRVGGTNFMAAFQQLSALLRQYQSSDDPAHEHQLNNISSVSIAFLTDGQDGSGVARDRLVYELQGQLQLAGWDVAEPNCPPLAVHAIGFSSGCDRNLLEAMRLAGNQEGLYRYADPSDDGDTLCNKLTALFELSSRASSVPIRLDVFGSPTQEIRFAVDSRRHGEYVQWVSLREDDDLSHVVVNSALDDNAVVPVDIKPPSQRVFQQWLSKCADDLASELVELVRGDQPLASDKVRQLKCAILEHQVGSLKSRVDAGNAELVGRVDFLKSQVEAIRVGTQVQLGKLSDLRFASLFAGGEGTTQQPRSSRAADIRTLPPQEVPQIDQAPAFEEPLKRYSRNNEGQGRNPLQEAIMDTVVDQLSDEMRDMIENSSPEDVLATDNDGNTATILASYCGHSSIVTALLKAHPGIDLGLQNHDGETAVTMAIKKRGFHHTLGALLEAGASIPRRKAIERFCIDNGYSITATIVANYGENSLEVDETMTAEYVRFVYQRARKADEEGEKNEQSDGSSEWDKAQFLNVALCKQLADIATELLEEGVQPTIDMLVKHCIPPKPDHPETEKYLDFAKLLMGHRPDLIFAKTEPAQETALFSAARLGSNPHVQYFIECLQEQTRGNPEKFQAELEAQNEKGNTPFWVASFMRFPCIMDVLLDNGADVNHANTKGNTPLYGVCCRGPPKIAEQLVRRGAHVDRVLKTGENHILLCCRNGTPDVLKTLLNYVDEDFVNLKAPIDGFNGIMAAAEQDHAECIRVLHEYGIDLDQVTDDDNQILSRATPLHIAAYYGRTKAAQTLLELGANPNAQDIHGSTPLHLAVIQGAVPMIEILRHAANLEVKDEAGYTPLAYCRNNKEIERLLINPLVAPLVELAKGGYSAAEEAQAIQILRSSGIPGVVKPSHILNVADVGGTKVLSHAICHSKKDLVETLLDLVVPVGMDFSGVHAVAWAHWSRNKRILKLLEAKMPQISTDMEALELQKANLERAVHESSVSADLLFPSQPPAYAPDPSSTICQRMQLFINAPCPVNILQEPFAEELPKLVPGDKHVDKCFDDNDLRELKGSRLHWTAKLGAVRQLAVGTNLEAAELVALQMFTNNSVVPEVLNTQLLQRKFSSDLVKDYVGVLHGGLSKLLPYQGEVFMSGADVDRKLYLKGRKFTWNRFVSASTLWRVSLENVPNFTTKAKKGVVFLIKSKTGRSVLNSMDAEVIFLPNTCFMVTNWYHGDVIALGQENIREHTFGIKEQDDTQRLNLQEMVESDRALIIELTEIP